jgi:hypothetical protein
MTPISNAVGIVRRNWRAYIAINLVYYGLVAIAMLYVASHPEIQKKLLKAVDGALKGKGPLAEVKAAYTSGNVAAAALWTFVINLLVGSFLYITLPSMIVPFSGLLMGAVRAILWGLLFSPANPKLAGGMIPHSLTLILEGQGYILALLAAYVAGNAFLRPHSVGAETHAKGHLVGLRQTASLYVLVTLTLAAAAVYEAVEVIYIVPLFR